MVPGNFPVMQLPLMLGCQRWFDRRSSFRLAQEPIVPAEFGVEPLAQKAAKEFVVRHHYSGSFPYSVQSFALYRKTSVFEQSRLVGVATFSTPSNPNSVQRWCGLPNEAGAELGRFVLLDECAGNAESWFLTRALRGFKATHAEVKCILSYSDPHPRRSISGKVTFPGHVGSIYAATNAFFGGRASPKTLYINADGRALANRVLSKLRNGERGHQGAERLLAEFTGVQRDEAEPVEEYIRRALATLRVERHAGNYVYLFPLASDRREKRFILSLPVLRERMLPTSCYPKQVDAIAA